jgi:hypothetical protein
MKINKIRFQNWIYKGKTDTFTKRFQNISIIAGKTVLVRPRFDFSYMGILQMMSEVEDKYKKDIKKCRWL